MADRYTPGANTLIYLPLHTAASDGSSHYTMTNNNVAFSNNHAVFNGTNGNIRTTTNFALSGNPAAFTFSFRIYPTATGRAVWGTQGGSAPWGGKMVGLLVNDGGYVAIWKYNSDVVTSIKYDLNKRQNIIMTSDGTTTKIYKNGVLGYAGNVTYNIYQRPLVLGGNVVNNEKYLAGQLDEFIGENVTRTDAQALEYFNNNKKYYGFGVKIQKIYVGTKLVRPIM